MKTMWSYILLAVFLISSANGGPASSSSSPSSPTCDAAFFSSRNLTVPPERLDSTTSPGPVCGGRCCSSTTESAFRSAGGRDLEWLLRHHARSFTGLFSTTANILQDHLTELTRQSENKTLYLFSQIYQRMSVFSKEPIGRLYLDIRSYVENTSDIPNPDARIEASVNTFFTDLFPLVYNHAINLHKDFGEDYKTCLRQMIEEVQPFGDIPKQISNSVFKSLEAMRRLLQGLTLGSEVLSTADSLLSEKAEKNDSSHSACQLALLKMSYCPKCLGLESHVKPCSGLCLNVLRGCLTQQVSELDNPWNAFVDALERLVIAMKSHETSSDVNVDTVIRGLDTRISEAIMYAMENGPSLEKKVKHVCGHARFSEDSPGASEAMADNDRYQKPPRPQRPARLSPPDGQMLHFLASVASSKGFFLKLADTVCQDDSFADQNESDKCWNGERIGEYTKTVVGSNTKLQKYNPEFEITNTGSDHDTTLSDSRVIKLSDKLRHMKTLLLNQMNSISPAAENHMQGDEAGIEGSGYDGYPDDDTEVPWSEGSGSGHGGIDQDTTVEIRKTVNGDNKVAGSPTANANAIRTSYLLISSLLYFTFFHHMRSNAIS